MTAGETIDNRWDILYRDYPEIYEEFISVLGLCPQCRSAGPVAVVIEELGLAGKEVADVGCGTGKSAIHLAKYAAKVVGIEPQRGLTIS